MLSPARLPLGHEGRACQHEKASVGAHHQRGGAGERGAERHVRRHGGERHRHHDERHVAYLRGPSQARPRRHGAVRPRCGRGGIAGTLRHRRARARACFSSALCAPRCSGCVTSELLAPTPLMRHDSPNPMTHAAA
eukprot:4612432-Prymnesium_polylepis.3